MSPHEPVPSPALPHLLRCLCGRLVGRLEDGALRTKCQRCKREVELDPSAEGECRCPCSRLLARSRPEGLELKCPRCKRELVVGRDGALR